jgi:FkbM family methyltransferase
MWNWLRKGVRLSGRLADYCNCFGIVRGSNLFLREIAGDRRTIRLSWDRTRFPIHLRLGTSDVITMVEVFAEEAYRIDPKRAPRIIVDAGANVGLTSVYFAERFPGSRVIAVEPEAANFEMLVRNSSQYPNIVPVRKAIWSSNVSLEIVDPGEGSWAFQVREPLPDDSGNHGAELLDGTTIDALMTDWNVAYIDILKMDIEGGEKEVFGSAGAWIDRVGCIAVELHDMIKPGCSRAFYNATNGFAGEIQRPDSDVVFVFRE